MEELFTKEEKISWILRLTAGEAEMVDLAIDRMREKVPNLSRNEFMRRVILQAAEEILGG